MGENTKIEWCDATLNFWIGCEKIAPGCENCYAASMVKRFGQDFSERRLTSVANRAKAFKWNADHLKFYREHGHRQRVFVNSMADVFDNDVPQTWRQGLWRLIRFTPHLDYILLTKRIGNAKRMLPEDFSAATYPNVWLGISACVQNDLDRDLQKLLRINTACHFISAEPMAEQLGFPDPDYVTNSWSDIEGYVDWIICGGESGPKARPLLEDHARRLRFHCRRHWIKFFFKQGSQTPEWGGRKGFKQFANFHRDLQIREHPNTQLSVWYEKAVADGVFDNEDAKLTPDQQATLRTLMA